MNYLEEHQEIKPTNWMIFKVWWSISWRSNLYTLLFVAGLFTIILLLSLILNKLDKALILIDLNKISLIIISTAIIYYLNYHITNKMLTKRRFKNFFVRIVPQDQIFYEKLVSKASIYYTILISLINILFKFLEFKSLIGNLRYLFIIIFLEFMVTKFVFVKKSFKDFRIVFLQNKMLYPKE